eukprot:12419694-Heterocapsa_arctica.AAC.1
MGGRQPYLSLCRLRDSDAPLEEALAGNACEEGRPSGKYLYIWGSRRRKRRCGLPHQSPNLFGPP